MMPKEKKLFSLQGFTLLELLVATTIIVLVVGTILTLFIMTIKSGAASKNELIATNLAREGLELTRNIRDNKWQDCTTFQGDVPRYCTTWDEWVDSNNDREPDAKPLAENSYIVIIDPFASMPNNPYLVENNDSLELSICQEDSNQKGMAYVYDEICYNYSSSSLSSGFIRIITFSPEDFDDNNINDKITVTSTVTWEERGAPKSVILSEELYNWYTK